MNAEAELHKQLRAIDPHYAITLDNRLWTCTVKVAGEEDTTTLPVVFVHLGKLQAMDGALRKVRAIIPKEI